MKTFSQSFNEKINRYATSEKLKNQIDKLIDECLLIQINGKQITEEVYVGGRDETISRLEKIVEREKIKHQISILEGIKKELLKNKITSL